MTPTIAIDFETFYSKELSIQTHGTRRYLQETDIYLVSGYGTHMEFCCHPKEVPWAALEGHVFLSHNVAFDEACVKELRRRGYQIPEPIAWHCTANLAAYNQYPRSLENAAKHVLGIQLNKGVRDKMKGKRFEELTDVEREEVRQYALQDAKACFCIWNALEKTWPEHERWLSRHTATMGWNGVEVDPDALRDGIYKLEAVKEEAMRSIPWALVGEKVTSPIQLRKECERIGITPPISTDSKDEGFELWLEENGESAPFVAAMGRYRKANRLQKVLGGMDSRRITGNDRRMSYDLKYFGASHTGRWSGSAGLNMQNLPRAPFEGVDARSCIIAKPGHRLLVADLAQIEARVALWLAKDERMFPMLREGMDLYEAYARAVMGYSDPRPLKVADPGLRQTIKGLFLGAQYGLWVDGFLRVTGPAGMNFTRAQAENALGGFRNRNKPIVSTWKTLERSLQASVGGESQVELPSGRVIRYFGVKSYSSGLRASVERGAFPRNYFGGALLENACQATAREIFAHCLIEVEKLGIPVVMHSHDELVAEVPIDRAEEAKMEVERVMSTPPDWAEGMPLAADAKIMERYAK